MGSPKRRWATPVLVTAVVLVVGAAGASTVFLVGSAQRRHDRAAYLRYERALLSHLRDGGRIVEQQMKPALAEIGAGTATAQAVERQALGWRSELSRLRARVFGLDPPGFLGDVEQRWGLAIDAYVRVADAIEVAATASGSERVQLITQAEVAGKAADALFDDAASVMQFHRRRLGLGTTRSLPDSRPAK